MARHSPGPWVEAQGSLTLGRSAGVYEHWQRVATVLTGVPPGVVCGLPWDSRDTLWVRVVLVVGVVVCRPAVWETLSQPRCLWQYRETKQRITSWHVHFKSLVARKWLDTVCTRQRRYRGGEGKARSLRTVAWVVIGVSEQSLRPARVIAFVELLGAVLRGVSVCAAILDS